VVGRREFIELSRFFWGSEMLQSARGGGTHLSLPSLSRPVLSALFLVSGSAKTGNSLDRVNIGVPCPVLLIMENANKNGTHKTIGSRVVVLSSKQHLSGDERG
jgi:hypothetical protein